VKVLAITNMFPSASDPGSGVFIDQQVKGLRSIGVQVRVLFVDRQTEGCFAYYRMRPRIEPAVAEFNPDLLHVMYGGVMADQVVRRHRLRPVVVTFHGSDLLGENLSGWVRRIISHYGVACSRRAAHAADGVIVVARHLLASLRRSVALDKVRVIPCGIDLARFSPMDPATCRRQLSWRPDTFHVLFVSNNAATVKRPELARAAVKCLTSRGIAAELHLLAGVPYTEVPVWLNASHALLLTSLHEGSPMVVKESLASGLPIVSVDVGDVAERIQGIPGCYLAEAQPADLALKLRMVHERGQRLECIHRLAEVSHLTVARRLQQFYEEMLRHPRAEQHAAPRSISASSF
jgi:glycosyltransferase involved in cell wall biosynthesis